jgi:hypothetical protein
MKPQVRRDEATMAVYDFEKTPGEVLDYQFRWTKYLTGEETIASSTWTLSAGLTKDSDVFDQTVTTVWLSAGIAGRPFTVTNTITTTSGRTAERTFTIRVVAEK